MGVRKLTEKDAQIERDTKSRSNGDILCKVGLPNGQQRRQKHIIIGAETHGVSSLRENMHFFHSI